VADTDSDTDTDTTSETRTPVPGRGLRARALAVRPGYRLEPGPLSRRLLPGAVGVGLAAAALVPPSRPGVNVPLTALLVAAPVLAAGHRFARTSRARTVLAVLALALTVVPAVRDSAWLGWSCLAAALCLGVAAALDARRWSALVGLPWIAARSAVAALPWAGRGARTARRISAQTRTGLLIGGPLVLVVGTLLVTGDAAFAAALGLLVPALDPAAVALRTAVFALVVLLVVTGAFAVRARVHLPRASTPARTTATAVWLIPVLLVGATIALFLLVQVATLFPGTGAVHGTTHAARAREGFGQLVAVTLIVAALLGWAGGQAARGDARDRRRMVLAGGALLGLALLLAASALRRLALYQDAYGWTVTRVDAWAFELWLVLVLLALGAGWLVRRADLVPRIVIASAGLGLLAAALAGPDAVTARGAVHRFETTGRIDVAYLRALSADAVPALSRLPEPYRTCVLTGRVRTADPWTGRNLSRARAAQVRPVNMPGEPCPGNRGR
jgi:hypothetical protein